MRSFFFENFFSLRRSNYDTNLLFRNITFLMKLIPANFIDYMTESPATLLLYTEIPLYILLHLLHSVSYSFLLISTITASVAPKRAKRG